MGRKHVSVALIFILAVVVYSGVMGHPFLRLDDNAYITGNMHVKSGLGIDSARWALTTFHSSNWHPLTWMSHMIDCDLFGLNPAGHHMINVILHAVNSSLLLLFLFSTTGALWESVVVAALFAVHPLQVESVAWVAERKNLLSTLFLMLTLLSYSRYARSGKTLPYFLSLCMFTLGLMAKPMLVTLPFLLILSDYWPLRRFRADQRDAESEGTVPGGAFRMLLLEKIPFLLLAVASSFVTLYAQQQGGSVATLESLPLLQRFANAALSYCLYIRNMLWPFHLSAFYPLFEPPPWKAGVAVLILSTLTLLVAMKRHSHPYLISGWLWYLVTLVPVIGLVQVGRQAMADRYTYVPLIGLFIMVTWGIGEITRKFPRHRLLVLSITGGIIAGCCICTIFQVRHWRDDFALGNHAIDTTENNYLAHEYLGDAFLDERKFKEAVAHHKEAARLSPADGRIRYRLGIALERQGYLQEAVSNYYEAVRLIPDSDLADCETSLGIALAKLERFDEAIGHLNEALRLNTRDEAARRALQLTLQLQGELSREKAKISRM